MLDAASLAAPIGLVAEDERQAGRARRADLGETEVVERATEEADVVLVEQVGHVQLQRHVLAEGVLRDRPADIEIDQRVGRRLGVEGERRAVSQFAVDRQVGVVQVPRSGVLDLRTEFEVADCDLATSTALISESLYEPKT